MAPGVFVRQVSLDVEQFCHETAQRICNEAGKKYFFCSDYNVEIVDVSYIISSFSIYYLYTIYLSNYVNESKSLE